MKNEHKFVIIGVIELSERHTAEYLKNWLLDLISEWNIYFENCIVLDNAANIKKAIINGFGIDKYLPCFAH